MLEQNTHRSAWLNARLDTAGQYQRSPVDLAVRETNFTVIDGGFFGMATSDLIEAFADRSGNPDRFERVEWHLHGAIVIKWLPGGREPLQMRSHPGPVFIRSKRNCVAPQALRAETRLSF